MLLIPKAWGGILVKGACSDYTQYDIMTAKSMALVDALGHYAVYSGKRKEASDSDGNMTITYRYSVLGVRIVKSDTITSANSLGTSSVTLYRHNKVLLRIRDGKPENMTKWHTIMIAGKTMGFKIKGFRVNDDMLIAELIKEE